MRQGPEAEKPFIQPKKELVVIVMGSPDDQGYAEKIKEILNSLGVDVSLRGGSAHKTPEHVLGLIREYEEQEDTSVVFIAVAGRANALGGLTDFATPFPVITAPIYSDKYGGVDIFSALRVPSGSGTTVAAEAEIAALAAVKIFSLNNPELRAKLVDYQRRAKDRAINFDHELRRANQ